MKNAKEMAEMTKLSAEAIAKKWLSDNHIQIFRNIEKDSRQGYNSTVYRNYPIISNLSKEYIRKFFKEKGYSVSFREIPVAPFKEYMTINWGGEK